MIRILAEFPTPTEGTFSREHWTLEPVNRVLTNEVMEVYVENEKISSLELHVHIAFVPDGDLREQVGNIVAKYDGKILEWNE